MSKTRLLFLLLAALLVASRLCHLHILWEGDTLPMAAAQQMLHGKVIYRDIWFDKPPLLPAAYLLSGAQPGWALRLEDALYALLACWIAYRFASDCWSRNEGLWAAGLLGCFLTFDFPSSVIPVASDLLMLAPHLAAVWMASRRKPFWSGVLVGAAFWISPKGIFVAVVCALWDPAGIPWMLAGFASAGGVVAAWLGAQGALGGYVEEVWRWGRLYAGNSYVEAPWGNGLSRTVNWLGFHIALVVGAAVCLWHREARKYVWVAWVAISVAAVAMGLRFFPRYYFQLLPPMVLLAARGMMLLGRKREYVALLLLIPVTRFGPSYVAALTDANWRDIAMDRDSRAASALVTSQANPGDTLFVWGYRPELYVYTKLPAATIYLDSQPLTGVPADRHLTHSEPVETTEAAARRTVLAQSNPAWVVDGLGLLNPQLAMGQYAELREWFANYREVSRTRETVIYRRR